MGKHPSGQSGSAMLWSIAVLAVLVFVTLALVMGRGKEYVPDTVPADMPSQKQVREPAKQDVLPRGGKRLRPPADPQLRPDRSPGSPRPDALRPGGPPRQPEDPRHRQRSRESSYDSRSPVDAAGDDRGDQWNDGSEFDDSRFEPQDDYDPEADVPGSPDPATPA